jgi:hypothetical protein
VFYGFLVDVVIYHEVVVCFDAVFFDCAVECAVTREVFGDSFADHVLFFLAKSFICVIA